MKTINTESYRQSNLVYQEDLEKLTPTRIMEFIKHHHDHQQPRLLKLDQYYQGRNVGILSQINRRIDNNHADYRASHSFAKYIADFQTAYSVGNAINIRGGENSERFDEINRTNDVDAQNYDLFLDVTRYGRAYEYVYRGVDDLEHFVKFDPLQTFIIYSLDVDPVPVMAVRYQEVQTLDENRTINVIPETWTSSEHLTYQPCAVGGQLTVVNKKSINSFPVIEYSNNNFRIGDFETVIPLIDLYDAAQSDTANYMTDLNDALLVIQGDIDTLFEGSDLLRGVDPNDEDGMAKLAEDKLNLIKEMKNANMLLLKSGTNFSGQQTSVDAKYINKEYDVNGTEAYKKRLASDIHKFSHTPDLNDENFAGNSSGVAMKYKVLGTVEMAATKRRMFESGLRERYRIVTALEKRASNDWNVDPDDLVFTFKDNLPTDDIETVKQLKDAGALIPQSYLYTFLPGVTDASEIAKQLADEHSQQVQQAKKDYGAQTDSEVNADDEEESTTETE